MSYRVDLDARADKQAEKVDRETLKRLQKRFQELAQNPFDPRISKPLTMSADRRTSQVGNWRIIYHIEDPTKTRARIR
jgi:mRNA interferase RelE/StbE